AKRVALLRELVPAAARVAVLLNPAYSPEATLKDLEQAARAMGMQLQVLNASNSGEINAAFDSFERVRADSLFVGPGPYFLIRLVQLAQLATRHAVPAAYAERDYVEVGGLMSYGASLTGAYREMGVYAGRILRGAQPADLPVLRASKFELVLNAETARMLRLTIPPTLLAIADEVIELTFHLDHSAGADHHCSPQSLRPNRRCRSSRSASTWLCSSPPRPPAAPPRSSWRGTSPAKARPTMSISNRKRFCSSSR